MLLRGDGIRDRPPRLAWSPRTRGSSLADQMMPSLQFRALAQTGPRKTDMHVANQVYRTYKFIETEVMMD